MPTTINGIGTHYYGKQNVEVRNAACPHCNSVGELKSYDTRLWFCFVFIPIIPLGRKRIIDQCPSCTMHSSMGVDDWEQLRTGAVREATAEYEADPSNAEMAVALHATLSSAGEHVPAKQFAQLLAERFSDNADVLLYLGAAHEETGDIALSNQSFLAAYEADQQNAGACQVSALALLREGKTDAARARLEQAETLNQPIDPGIAFGVAQALQQEGNPEASAKLLRKVREAAPDAHKDKTFRKLAKSVEQATGEQGSLAPPRPLLSRPAFWWSAAALAVVVGVVWRDFHLSANQAMYVVNGLPTTIAVQIDDGEPLRITAESHRRVGIGGGQHTVRVVSPENMVGEASFAIESQRTSRWFRQPVHVLSPTRSNVVIWEETVFSKHQIHGKNKHDLTVGRLLSSFDNADYLFREFPPSLQVKDTTKQVTKSRVDSPNIGPMGIAIGAPEQLRNPSILEYLEPHLLFEEDRDDVLQVYIAAALEHNALDRCYKFLESHLDEQPINLEWHRSFQSIAEMRGDADLALRYDRLLEASPRNASLLYLRGRLENYGQHANAFYQQALETDPDHKLTMAAVGFSAANHGDFLSALDAVRKALVIDPELSTAADLRKSLLIALGRQKELEAECRVALQEQPMNFGATTTLITCQTSRGRDDLAQQTQQSFAQTVQAEWPADPHELGKRTEEHLHRSCDDYQAAERVAQTMQDPRNRRTILVTCNLLSGEADQAEAMIPQLHEREQAVLMLWCSLLRANQNDPAADKSRQRTADLLDKVGGVHAEAARLLREKPDNSALADQAADLDLTPATKAALLLLVAETLGDEAPRLVKLAKELNRLPSAFQPLLENALAAWEKR